MAAAVTTTSALAAARTFERATTRGATDFKVATTRVGATLTASMASAASKALTMTRAIVETAQEASTHKANHKEDGHNRTASRLGAVITSNGIQAPFEKKAVGRRR